MKDGATVVSIRSHIRSRTRPTQRFGIRSGPGLIVLMIQMRGGSQLSILRSRARETSKRTREAKSHLSYVPHQALAYLPTLILHRLRSGCACLTA